VFWLEHDLHCQLLLIRHLWWLSQQSLPSTRVSIVMDAEHLGLLKPAQFPERFERRRPISPSEIAAGEAAWIAFCGDDPRRLEPLARDARPLVYLPLAMRRMLEEFPAPRTGLGRSERQILEVLSDGPRSPEQAFVAASRHEEDIWMGDSSFWTIVKRLAGGAHPLIDADVREVEDHLPSGTIAITDAGRRVLAGDADHLALNAPSRWIGGTHLTPERQWRWTGAALFRA
jgi:hypothetical protein